MLKLRGMDPSTLWRAVRAGRQPLPRPTHVFLCVVDHFEPAWQTKDATRQAARIAAWVEGYAAAVDGLGDSRGRPPQHTFFYPIESYHPEHVESLTELVDAGYGDIEVHLHHDNDTEANLRELLVTSVEQFHRRHGLFTRDDHGQLRYGFVHGNWALDNSHPTGRWCGVNNEISVLQETGCYADFTMPAAPHAAQTKTINQVYYVVDDPQRPKSHDRGTTARVGRAPPAKSLLMIQGPLLVAFRPGIWRPHVENGNLMASQPPQAGRLHNWLRAGVCVEGHPQWHFIKLHTHGAQEKNARVLLGEPMRNFHRELHTTAEQMGFEYHYVTAREMAQLVVQAEQRTACPRFDSLGWSSPGK